MKGIAGNNNIESLPMCLVHENFNSKKIISYEDKLGKPKEIWAISKNRQFPEGEMQIANKHEEIL